MAGCAACVATPAMDGNRPVLGEGRPVGTTPKVPLPRWSLDARDDDPERSGGAGDSVTIVRCCGDRDGVLAPEDAMEREPRFGGVAGIRLEELLTPSRGD